MGTLRKENLTSWCSLMQKLIRKFRNGCKRNVTSMFMAITEMKSCDIVKSICESRYCCIMTDEVNDSSIAFDE